VILNLFDDEELTVKMCKFGGPLVLFVCAPVYTWILFSVTKKALDAGESLSVKGDLLNFLSILPFIWFGVWMCRKGYGWFGDSNR
jgi:hypothetical protein